MKKILSLLTILTLVLASCSTSNEVASNHLIQKRKHNKGFHFKKRGKIKAAHTNEGESIAFNTKSKKTKVKKAKTDRIAKKTKIETVVASNTFSAEKKTNNTSYTNYEQQATTPIIGASTDSPINETITEEIVENTNVAPTANEAVKSTKTEELTNKRALDSDIALILGILLCIIGLAPLGVYIVHGSDSRTRLTFLLWIVGIIACVLGAIVLGILYTVGGLLLLAAAIYGILAILDIV